MELPSNGGEDASVRLEIDNAGGRQTLPPAQSSFSHPHPEVFRPLTPAPPGGGGGGGAADKAPERKLILFAFHLAMLEKFANVIGTLAFVWATVVILGGFAITLDRKDFFFVTAIIVVESFRVFSRNNELEWHNQSAWEMAAAATEWSSFRSFRGVRFSSFGLFQFIFRFLFDPSKLTIEGGNAVPVEDRSMWEVVPAAVCWSVLRTIKFNSQFSFLSLDITLRRHGRGSVPQINQAEADREGDRNCPSTEDQRRVMTVSVNSDWFLLWQLPDVPLFAYPGLILVLKKIRPLLLELQIALSAYGMVLSITRLVQHGHGEVASEISIRNWALIIFYFLALAEAMIILIRKVYWWWKFYCCYLFQVVNRACFPGSTGGVDVAVTCFFCNTYSKLITCGFVDGLKMDLVSFATELLASNLRIEQLIGARVLRSFSRSKDFGSDTLRKIGTSNAVLERLVEMLSWTNPHLEEEELRRCAAKILKKLAGKRQYVLRVGAVPTSIDAISSLLEKPAPEADGDNGNYDFLAFNLLGLSLLKKLAANHDNCWKIGNSSLVLSKIIDFTGASRALLADKKASKLQIKTVKRALELVKMLAAATGSTGKMLRINLSVMIFTVSNVREIIRYGELHKLQTPAIEILKSLAMNRYSKEQIGGTGQVTSLLLAIFLKPSVTNEEMSLRNQAGETLSILALENQKNCNRIADEPEALSRLIKALDDGSEIQLQASRILRNLCAYGGPGTGFRQHPRPLIAALPTVLKAIIENEGKLLEASLGLATQICELTTTPGEFSDALRRAGVEEAELAEKLAAILQEYASPGIKVPRMRRFVINLVIWMIKSNESSIDQFKELGMERLLESVAETTSELECFHIFSGSIGFVRQSKTMLSHVEEALKIMRSFGIVAESKEGETST
ncbi:uncharacterized protein LOC122002987 [Zingiber officinale]|uniref:ARM repeat superfamily protein n=1 Tax=Zingiber officinale TaxID=94328 RepID=A0A8J5G199_ZINOF|nr:uncharacterized protein LOC122002987 [Zingiber officinale]KAG6494451.1 hypothetical protein ZIOFF_049477 [Zingiber officinale]